MQLRQPLNLRKPLQMTAHKIRPTLNLPFAASGSLGPLITYTGQNGTYFNSSGTLTAATTNVARFDYDPSTLIARGLLIEEARTNSIRNNTMVGASAGTPGTDPTNWLVTAAGGTVTTKEIVGSGTESGISYVDVRYVLAASAFPQVIFDSTTQIVASETQTWTSSMYVRLVGGSTSNVTLANRIVYRTAAGASVNNQDVAIVPTSAGLATQRSINTFLATGATIARVTNQIAYSSSGAVDITLRIGMPQLELGAFATSVISTSTVAVTRAADIASITGANFTSFWNATQGTLVVGAAISSANLVSKDAYSVSDGGSTNRIVTRMQNGAGQIVSVVRSGATTVATLTSTVAGSTTSRKVATAYALDNYAISVAGETPVTDTSGALPVALTQMNIGSLEDGSEYLNGWISSLSYYPVRLTNTQIQTLST